MPYTIPNIILWAKMSQPLAAIGEAQKKAFQGGSVEEELDWRIYMTRKDVEYEYAQDPTSENLYAMGNFLYALCFPYVLTAQFNGGGSGGQVTPTSPTGIASPYYFIVSASTPIATGGTTLNLPSSWTGHSLSFARNGVVQTDVDTEPTYFSYDTATRILIITPAAVEGELFAIEP